MLLCLARISVRAQPVDQSSGQLFRWPLRVGAREVEIVPSSGVIADASEAVLATIAAGAGIGMATSLMASGWVRRGAYAGSGRLCGGTAQYHGAVARALAVKPGRPRLLARRCLGSNCQKRP